MLKIGNLTIPHPLIMAPMCGLTHKAFRKVVKSFGAGLVMTQMVSSKALTMGDQKTKKLLEFDDSERPIGFQIFGNNAELISEAAKICQDMGADLVDLNMGCPARKIVNDGGGSALMKEAKLVEEIFEKTRRLLHIPFTVKMRAGWDKNHLAAIEISQLAEKHGLDAVCLHGRTRAQGYSGSSDWKLIADLKQAVSIPVIGNGDIKTIADVDKMMSQTGCDAVMIGRAAISKPWFFQNYQDRQEQDLTSAQLKELILKQYDAFFDYFGPATGLKQMRKHLCAYTKGLKGSSRFRNQIIRMESFNDVTQIINDFF